MILDTDNVPSFRCGIEAMNDIRKSISRFKFDETIVPFSAKNINVVKYYTVPKILLSRICDIAGVPLKDATEKHSKNFIKIIAYNIMKSFGHSDNDLLKCFNMAVGQKGITPYYADRLRDLMIRNPAVVEVYSIIISVLEKDKSNLNTELYD